MSSITHGVFFMWCRPGRRNFSFEMDLLVVIREVLETKSHEIGENRLTTAKNMQDVLHGSTSSSTSRCPFIVSIER